MEPSVEVVIPLGVRVCMDKRTESKMEPERGALESSSAGTDPEAPVQQRLSSWEMQRNTADGCSLVDVSLELGETLLPLKISLFGQNLITKLSHLSHHEKSFFCR